MMFAVCIVAVCPLRSEASHRSEMVSQLLFGEAAEVLEATTEFIKVRCLYDGYLGWAQKSQLAEVDRAVALREPLLYACNKNATLLVNKTEMQVPVGTPLFQSTTVGSYCIEYNSAGAVLLNAAAYTEGNIKEIAFLYENVPYLWGGKSSFGIDCSGFVQQVTKLFGKPLQRDAYQQAMQGDVVHFLQEAQCGDIAFFDNEEGRIVHVGILLNSHTIIHASGSVRIDDMDSFGIINHLTKQRTHKLRVIKRM